MREWQRIATAIAALAFLATFAGSMVGAIPRHDRDVPVERR